MSDPFTRRTALAGGLGLFGGLGLTPHANAQDAEAGGPIARSLAASVGADGAYTLPPLPYDDDALEPSIDAETMRLHHDRHHAGYVKGANEALARLADIRAGKLDASAVSEWSEKLAFNLSGHLLHATFWAAMGPGGGRPAGTLATDLAEHFGSIEAFKSQFSAAAAQVQGNGWAVLAFEPVARRLVVLQARNHQLNVAWNAAPLLVIDVWEHAYYLKYKNMRADYVNAFWSVVNWAAVGDWYALVKQAHPSR